MAGGCSARVATARKPIDIASLEWPVNRAGRGEFERECIVRLDRRASRILLQIPATSDKQRQQAERIRARRHGQVRRTPGRCQPRITPTSSARSGATAPIRSRVAFAD
jgi:hypothetical protein